MHWLRRLFGDRKKPETDVEPKIPDASETGFSPEPPPADREIVFSRMTPDPKPAPRGQERGDFLIRIKIVLGDEVGSIDTSKFLQADYGLDEMNVSECVQLAEEVWAVQLMPNPMRMEDYRVMLRRFPTLEAIIQEAEAAAAARRSHR